jgi:hypothetical protein
MLVIYIAVVHQIISTAILRFSPSTGSAHPISTTSYSKYFTFHNFILVPDFLFSSLHLPEGRVGTTGNIYSRIFFLFPCNKCRICIASDFLHKLSYYIKSTAGLVSPEYFSVIFELKWL